MAEEEDVYIRGLIYPLKNVVMILPMRIRHYLFQLLLGEGMNFFIGR